jgi:hypothetical protein
MTTRRAEAPLPTDRGAGAAPIDAADAVAAVALWHASVLRRDAITLSERAAALVRAGLAVRAYVMQAWQGIRMIATFANGRTIVLDNGIYR